ncbi:MAG: hypothetical protein ABR559_04610 [Gemmatimonadota bacterium]
MSRWTMLPALLCVMALACAEPAEETATTATETAGPAAEGPVPGTPEWRIAEAMSAGPQDITAGAAVMDWPTADGGEMAELRAGTNGWVCMPDNPATGGPDPMCLDSAFQSWAAAWQGHTEPAITQIGLAYMLQGDAGASLTDPYATAPTEGADWVVAGPHVMIITPDAAQLEAVSADPAAGPYVMWKGTPYAHIMVPVAAAVEAETDAEPTEVEPAEEAGA